MGTFSALLALCAGNSPAPVNSPHKGQWRGALMFSFIRALIKDWENNREAGDLRRHRGHYDVIVMVLSWFCDDYPSQPMRCCETLTLRSRQLTDYYNTQEDQACCGTLLTGSKGQTAATIMLTVRFKELVFISIPVIFGDIWHRISYPCIVTQSHHVVKQVLNDT